MADDFLKFWRFLLLGILLVFAVVMAVILCPIIPCIIVSFCLKLGKGELHRPANEITTVVSNEIQEIVGESAAAADAEERPILPQAVPEIEIDMGKVEHRVVFSGRGASSREGRATSGADTRSFA